MAFGNIQIKRGSTLRLQVMCSEEDGSASDLTGVTMTAHLRTPADVLVTALPIIRTDEMGVATIEVADTTNWPLGLLRGDFRVVIDGKPFLSETFGVQVTQGFTR
jgi:hypothetical protein